MFPTTLAQTGETYSSVEGLNQILIRTKKILTLADYLTLCNKLIKTDSDIIQKHNILMRSIIQYGNKKLANGTIYYDKTFLYDLQFITMHDFHNMGLIADHYLHAPSDFRDLVQALGIPHTTLLKPEVTGYLSKHGLSMPFQHENTKLLINSYPHHKAKNNSTYTYLSYYGLICFVQAQRSTSTAQETLKEFIHWNMKCIYHYDNYLVQLSDVDNTITKQLYEELLQENKNLKANLQSLKTKSQQELYVYIVSGKEKERTNELGSNYLINNRFIIFSDKHEINKRLTTYQIFKCYVLTKEYKQLIDSTHPISHVGTKLYPYESTLDGLKLIIDGELKDITSEHINIIVRDEDYSQTMENYIMRNMMDFVPPEYMNIRDRILNGEIRAEVEREEWKEIDKQRNEILLYNQNKRREEEELLKRFNLL